MLTSISFSQWTVVLLGMRQVLMLLQMLTSIHLSICIRVLSGMMNFGKRL